jgi:(2Fe-2S) ferredoxin
MNNQMTHYKKHVFVCTNQKVNGKKCCELGNGSSFCAYLKQKVADLGLSGKDKIRVSASGCLGRCAEGPCLVIYPEGNWYTYRSQEDIDAIVKQHILDGEIIDRLKLG